MKYLSTYLLLLLLIMSGCSNDDSELSLDETTRIIVPSTSIHYIFTPLDSIIHTGFSREPSSDSFLLEARRYVDDYPTAFDDERTDVLVIPLPNGILSFEYTDEELTEQGGIFLAAEDCFCGTNTPYAINQGSLSGTKNSDGSWEVRGSVGSREESGQSFPWDISGTYK